MTHQFTLPPPTLVTTSLGRVALRDLQGNGVPLLLWPSLFSDHHLYDRLVPRLRERWRVILVDGPGFGDSDPPRPNTQPGTYAAAIPAILDRLGIKRAVFAGTSWGGQIGAYLAADHADRIAAVLMMNTPLAPSIGGHLFEVATARLAVRSNVYANGVARAMLTQRSLQDPQIMDTFTSRFRHFVPRHAAITANTTLRKFRGLADVLPRARVPLTIMMGAEDRLYPPSDLMPLARRASGARILVVENCAHLAPLEAPQAVTDALDTLARLAQI